MVDPKSVADGALRGIRVKEGPGALLYALGNFGPSGYTVL